MKTEMISKVGMSFVFSILMFSGLVVAQGFQDVISTLKDIGVFQFYLPFLLVFAILFGLLQKVNIFHQKGINIVISLVIAGFVMVYTPVGITFGQFLTNFAGNAVVVILTLVLVILFVSMLSTGKIIPDLQTANLFTKGWGLWLILLFVLLIVFGVFVASGGTSIFPGIRISAAPLFETLGGLSAATWALIILVVGTALIVLLFSGKGEDQKKTP